MGVVVSVPAMSVEVALGGMRRHFFRAFGPSWVGRQVASAAWPAFSAALLRGHGIDAARELSLLAALERNSRAMLVARWTRLRVQRVVADAVDRAANSV